MQFKINTTSSDSLLAIQDKIRNKFPNAALAFEVNNEENVLKVNGLPSDNLHAEEIERAIAETGFNGSWLQRGIDNK